ncbi:hypothetical protein [Prochlorococcus sp. MIT 1341]|uniref:hypothetical protein n=1 Tax=Prochlorococcus sp. MIT 1341 TaxID=3096221 RepID=UPI002A75E75E|nr:hypothetical protein [Prochlorococcus sp. MIT 1341]
MQESSTNHDGRRVELKRTRENCASLPCSRTYFVSGFDPRGANHYLALFQKELQARGASTGKRITNGLITRWPIKKKTGNEKTQEVETLHQSELCFLHWDDIARANWPKQPLEILKQCMSYASFYLFRGWVFRIAKLCPGVALCGAYPLLFLLIALCFATITATLSIELFEIFSIPAGKYLISLTLWFSTLFAAWKLAEALGVIWLTRSILFTHRLGQAKEKDLRQRVCDLAVLLINLEEKEPAERIIIIGHSSGSFVAAMLAAELKRQDNSANLLSRIELLTLGQNLTNLSIYPEAKSFRDDLKFLAEQPRFPWRDVTSQEDLLCFAGVNPFITCGIAIPKGSLYPKMEIISLSLPRKGRKQKRILLDQFDIHFDYLRNHCPDVDLPGLLTKPLSREY